MSVHDLARALPSEQVENPELPSSKLNIYTSIDGKTLHASHYYRQMLPLEAMEQLVPVQGILDMNDTTTPAEARIKAMSYCDVNLIYQPTGEGLLALMRNAKKWHPCFTGTGEIKYPPIWIFDTDDNLMDVPPTNFTFKKMGIRRPDGSMLKRGDIIRWNNNGVDEILWADTNAEVEVEPSRRLDIEANQRRMSIFRDLMREAHGLTCTTPIVEQYVRRELREDANVFIFPNCVHPGHYPTYDLAEHPGEIRVLWQGSPTHYEDFYFLKDALIEAARRWPQTKWIFWGCHFREIIDAIPEDRLKLIGWQFYPAYRPMLAGLAHDINLAILNPTRFNATRSAIKWYESSVISRPAATIAHRGPVYSEIEDGQTGMLFGSAEEFLEKFGILVEQHERRRAMAQAAQEWVLTHRHIDDWAPRLYDFYVKTIRARNATLKAPTEPKFLTPVQARQRLKGKQRATSKHHQPDHGKAADRRKRRGL